MPSADLTLKIDLIPGQHRQFAAFLVLVGMLGSFAFIRTSARLMRSPRVPWWPGSVKTGDLHVHHLVFGIVLVLLAGFLEFAFRAGEPWLYIFAIAFGIGAGLTLDEYALWLHLEDVYWAEEGRRSVDAVVIAALLGTLIVLGAVPVTKEDTASLLTLLVALLIVVGLSTIAALKGKYVSAIAGMLVPLISLTAAIRLAKPGSRWARRRYPEDGAKREKATARFERIQARYQRVQDLIGGAPSTTESQ